MLVHMANQVELQEQNLPECTESDPNSGDDNGLLLQTEVRKGEKKKRPEHGFKPHIAEMSGRRANH